MDYLSPDYDHCALVIVDYQNDYIRPGAPFEFVGSGEFLPELVELATGMRAAGRPIVHMVRGYMADGSNVDLCRRHVVKETVPLLQINTSGADFPDELKPEGAPALRWSNLLAGGIQPIGAQDVVIHKARWGAFYNTQLEGHLRALGVNTLIVCGCNFPTCPRATIFEASERDFRLVLATDVTSGLTEQGLDEVQKIGVHLATHTDVLNAL